MEIILCKSARFYVARGNNFAPMFSRRYQCLTNALCDISATYQGAETKQNTHPYCPISAGFAAYGGAAMARCTSLTPCDIIELALTEYMSWDAIQTQGAVERLPLMAPTTP